MHDLGSVQTARIKNLRGLIEGRFDNTVARFCDAVDKPQSLISGILFTPPRKSFGERLARDVEKALDLPPGWLDQIDSVAPQSDLPPREDMFLLGVRRSVQHRDIPSHVMQTVLFLLESCPKHGGEEKS